MRKWRPKALSNLLLVKHLVNGETRIQTQALGLQSHCQPLNKDLLCARPCSRCLIGVISYSETPPMLHAMGQMTSILQVRNMRPWQAWTCPKLRGQIRIWTEVSLNRKLSNPHQSPTLATRQGGTSITYFPPGCVTVDWIFASVPVLLRDTWTPAGPRGCPLLRTCHGEGSWIWPRSKVLLSRVLLLLPIWTW